MKEKAVKVVTFSPTHTTYKVCESIAKGIGLDYEIIDLTLPRQRMGADLNFEDAIVIIGMPVYVGRVPVFAAGLFKQMHGNNTPAIIVCVYGNRHYDDALIEMYDIAKAQGFVPIAAAACIGEHSFSTDSTPLAVGRPSEEDLAEEYSFGQDFRKKWDSASAIDDFALKVPDESGVYKTFMPSGRKPSKRIPPVTKPGHKDEWIDCAKVCPTAAMFIKDDNLETDPEKCLLCMACVKAFSELRAHENPVLLAHAKELSETYAAPRKNEFFL